MNSQPLITSASAASVASSGWGDDEVEQSGGLCKNRSMSASTDIIHFLPKHADLAEVCAWLTQVDSTMARYFPSVFHSNVDGFVLYNEPIVDIIGRLGVIDVHHQESLKQVWKIFLWLFYMQIHGKNC